MMYSTHFNALKSTRSMRRRLKVKCSLESDQMCHKVGLNIIKVLFNHDAVGWENDNLLFDTIVKWVNLDSNIYCCSTEVNSNDKVIEMDLLDCILYKRRTFSSLLESSQDSVAMYTLLMTLLYNISKDVALKDSPTSKSLVQCVIDQIRTRINDKHLNSTFFSQMDSNPQCFICTSKEAKQFDHVFLVPCCSEWCQLSLWGEYGLTPMATPLSSSSLLTTIATNSTKSIILSPFSLNYCLLLLYLASASKYRTSIAQFLAIDDKTQDSIIVNLPQFNLKHDDGVVINSQTILFYRNNLVLKDKRIFKSLPNITIQAIDILNVTKLVKEVNDFSNKNSNGLIPSIISETDLTKDLTCMIVNTLYFNAKWMKPFHSYNNIQDRSFYSSFSGKTLKMTFMSRTGRFKYGATDKHQYIMLPYETYSHCMFIILARDKNSKMVPSSEITEEYFSYLNNASCGVGILRKVELYLPKFESRSRLEIFEPLMKKIPNLKENPLNNLFTTSTSVSNIIQQGVIKVTEEGTEAAATTVVLVNESSSAPSREDEEPVIMDIDHSFYYTIVNNKHNYKLFEGFYDGSI